MSHAAAAAGKAAAVLAEAAGFSSFGFLDPCFSPGRVASGFSSGLDTAAHRSATDPHLTQVLDMPIPMPDEALPLLLHPQAPTAIYRRRRDEAKSVVHWGQRKLLASEITFLLMMGCSPTPQDIAMSAESIATTQAALLAVLGDSDRSDEVSIAMLALSEALQAILALGGPEIPSASGSRAPFPYAAWFVYAGAAPGTHVPILAALFPRVLFILIDPAPFKCGYGIETPLLLCEFLAAPHP